MLSVSLNKAFPFLSFPCPDPAADDETADSVPGRDDPRAGTRPTDGTQGAHPAAPRDAEQGVALRTVPRQRELHAVPQTVQQVSRFVTVRGGCVYLG